MEDKVCRWVKKRLGLYIDNEIDSISREKIEEHLSKCELCRAEFAGLEKINSIGKGAHYSAPSDDYWASVMPRVNKRTAEAEKETAAEKIIIFFREFFAYNNFARNAFGAAAAAVIIIFIIKFNKQFPEFFSPKQEETAQIETADDIKKATEEFAEAEIKDKQSSIRPEKKTEKLEEPSKAVISDEKPTAEKEKIADEVKIAAKREITSEDKPAEKKEEIEKPPQEGKAEQMAISEEKTEKEEKPKEFTLKDETIEQEKAIEEKEVQPARPEVSLSEKRPEIPILPRRDEKLPINIPQKDIYNAFNKTIRKPLIDENSFLKQAFSESAKSKESESQIEEIDETDKEQLLQQKEKFTNLLKNNDDSIKEIIYLKELDEIYKKLLSFGYDKEIFGEADYFYKNYKDKLIDILGSSGYRERIEMLKRVKR